MRAMESSKTKRRHFECLSAPLPKVLLETLPMPSSQGVSVAAAANNSRLDFTVAATINYWTARRISSVRLLTSCFFLFLFCIMRCGYGYIYITTTS
jgi:hypothetical protein